MGFSLSYEEPEPAPGGYIINGFGFAVDDDGRVLSGFRLDAGWVETIDAEPPIPPEPEGGWPQGTKIIRGRPFLPLDPSCRVGIRSSSQRASAPPACPLGHGILRRRQRPLQPRFRRVSRTRGSPGKEDGGSGDPEPLGVATPRLRRAHRAETRTVG